MARAEAYLHAKFHLDPSNRLAAIHQCHRQTDRQTGQDRQQSDSIGRTILQTVTQKFKISAKLLLLPSKLICLTFRQHMPQKYHSNNLLNFCAICEVQNQNTDNSTMFRIWSDHKLREVYATYDFIIVRS